MEIKSNLDLQNIQSGVLSENEVGIFIRFHQFEYFDHLLSGELTSFLQEKVKSEISSFVSVKEAFYIGNGDFFIKVSDEKENLPVVLEDFHYKLAKMSSRLDPVRYWCIVYKECGLRVNLSTQIVTSQYLIDKKQVLPCSTNFLDSAVINRFSSDLTLLISFPLAIVNHDIYFEFQPIVDVKYKKVVKLEVLARWEHQNRKIPPSEFIPVISSSPYARVFDIYLIESICDRFSEIRRVYGDVEISINLSSEAISEDEFISIFIDVMEKKGVEFKSFVVEITELSPLRIDDDIWKNIFKLKSRGIKIALDDFGSGYTCFSNLRNLPIDYLKVDRALTNGLIINKTDLDLVHLLLSFCRSRNIEIVFEGIEDSTQMNFLLSIGARIMQGFYFSKPQRLEKLYVPQEYKKSVRFLTSVF
ncbi:EAL domain-containing protein [Pseudoalteromonas xiamenensis]|uniref:EAL domain-containing protein n=1 Tax=Pseudoalteromonas xiamenensis TaxID=882626 RepID=UPI0035ED597C